MPINMMINILGSVGAGGKNQRDDVRAVQRQLNNLMNPPRKRLVEDGLSGKKTVGTIRDFQRSVCGFRKGDGRVDPGGKTLRHLNDANSEGKWAGMSMMPTDYTPAPSDEGAGGGAGDAVPTPNFPPATSKKALAQFDRLWTAVHVKKNLSGQKEAYGTMDHVLDTFIKDGLGDVKTVHAIMDLMNSALDAGKLAYFAKGFKIFTADYFGNPQAVCKALSGKISIHGASRTMRVIAAMGQSPRLAGIFKASGRALTVAAICFCLMEARNHFNKGHYGPAAKEIYKGLGGIGCLPLAVVDAVQTVWTGMDPATANGKEENVLYEIIRHGNLLDHGGNAVDAIATVAEFSIKGVKSGKMDMQMLDALVERMRNSSGKNFVLLGEFLGDWYYDELVKAGKLGEDIGDHIGDKYGRHLLPLVKFFDL